MWTAWNKPDRNDDPQTEQCNRCKQWHSTWSFHQWQLHFSTLQMPWSDHYMKQKWEMSYILHYMIHFHHQPTFWVLPSLVILTHLEHKTRFYLTSTTGAWTACSYWNCSLHTNSTIRCFTMSTFPLSCSFTDYALYFKPYKNSKFLSDILRKSLSSIHYIYNIQPFLNWG